MNTSTHPRDRLINTAATLVHKQGWTATGINQILAEAGIPKGSFYYYFRSKEALGVAVVQNHHAQLKALFERTLENAGLSPDAAIYELMKSLSLDGTIPTDDAVFKYGCPIGALVSEIATQSPALLAEANRCLSLYETAWQNLITRGQKEGSIVPTIDPVEISKVATMALQGALHSVRRLNTVEPLSLVFSWIHQILFSSAAAKSSQPSTYPKLQILAS